MCRREASASVILRNGPPGADSGSDRLEGDRVPPKKKFYAVRRGRTPGVYATWAECQRQTTGFKGAEFKSFPSREAAESWLEGGAAAAAAATGTAPSVGIAVDGACSGNPGPMEYRGVDLATGEALFSHGPFDGGTNNLAEFLAIVEAAQMVADGRHPGPVFSDSRTAMIWVEKGRHNSTVDERRMDPALRLMVEAAEDWLARQDRLGGIVKWETDAWGEIPADYGRKV